MRGLRPVLPLRDFILLPGKITRVTLGRPDELAALDAHLRTQRSLVAAVLHDPSLDAPLGSDLMAVACEARALRTVRLGDGTVCVLIEGLARVEIASVKDDPANGLSAEIRPVRESLGNPAEVEILTTRLREELREFIQGDAGNPPALARVLDMELAPGRLADLVAGNLTVPLPGQAVFLAECSVQARLELALEGIGREAALRAVKLSVDKKVQDTMDRQQREYFLREQIRGLRQELDEVPRTKDEMSDLEQRLRDIGMPEEGLKEALRELDRLRRMHPDAAEYTVLRTWLDWLVHIPWTTTTEDHNDLKHAAQVLNAGHYGLEKVKDRILEYLAVRTLKPDGRGPVLCFVGPPGVGKTSLGRGIAEALGRRFERISLGGMKDEAEIRGHRRTYVGSLPGRLVHALKRAGTKNPVIVLDEIDKLGKDFRGDPAAALLEVLDPEQNSSFVDHYIDIPVDLSQVLFLCTANQRAPIPAALIDRLEVIEIPGYILEEKLKIARNHLLPRLREAHGLGAYGFQITRPAVQHVIEAYTAEAGVRGLEQRLAALHRKAARKFVEGRTRTIRIDSPDRVRQHLGPPRHFVELAERADMPGIAIGLAWTASGGDILFIEVTGWPADKGSLHLTGQLGAVMKESGNIAVSVVRSRADALGIDPGTFDKKALHLHVPAGAVPKDGPSAGITMVTAIASLLTGRLVRPHVAMTGEVTLRGKVLPVGGIKEKVLAARRAGVTEIIMPHRNENDLEDVPSALRRELSFHFVEHIDQVLELALVAPPEPPAPEL
jgi:ATP-dependent Lon protease